MKMLYYMLYWKTYAVYSNKLYIIFYLTDEITLFVSLSCLRFCTILPTIYRFYLLTSSYKNVAGPGSANYKDGSLGLTFCHEIVIVCLLCGTRIVRQNTAESSLHHNCNFVLTHVQYTSCLH